MKYSAEYLSSETCLMSSHARLKSRVALPITSYHWCMLSPGLTDADMNFTHLDEVMFVRFLHCQFTLSSLFPQSTLWKEVAVNSLKE